MLCLLEKECTTECKSRRRRDEIDAVMFTLQKECSSDSSTSSVSAKVSQTKQDRDSLTSCRAPVCACTKGESHLFEELESDSPFLRLQTGPFQDENSWVMWFVCFITAEMW